MKHHMSLIAFAASSFVPATGQGWLQALTNFGSAGEHVRAMDADPRPGSNELAVALTGVASGTAPDDRIALYALDQDGLLAPIDRLVPSGPLLSIAGAEGLHLSHGGDRIALGSRDASGQGRVHVFDRMPSGWVEAAVLTGAAAFGSRGFDDPQLDGDRLLVLQSDPGASISQIHTFRDSPSGWQTEGSIVLPCVPLGCRWSAALDGDCLVVARAAEVDLASFPEGSPVTTYRWSGAEWVLEDRLDPPPGTWFSGPLALEDELLIFTENEPPFGAVRKAFVHVVRKTTAGFRRVQRFDHRPAEGFIGVWGAAISGVVLRGRELIISSEQYRVATRYRWNGAEFAPEVGYRVSGFGFGGPNAEPAEFIGDRVAIGRGALFLFEPSPMGRADYNCFAEESIGWIGLDGNLSLSQGNPSIRVSLTGPWGAEPGAMLLMGFGSAVPAMGNSPLCLSTPLLRLGPGVPVSWNSTLWQIGHGQPFSALTPGTTAYFQYWTPASSGPPAGRVTHSIALTFTP